MAQPRMARVESHRARMGCCLGGATPTSWGCVQTSLLPEAEDKDHWQGNLLRPRGEARECSAGVPSRLSGVRMQALWVQGGGGGLGGGEKNICSLQCFEEDGIEGPADVSRLSLWL